MTGRTETVRTIMAAVLAVGAIALSGSLALAQDAEPMQVRIEMGEFYFQVEGQERNEAIVLQAGQPYELLFANVGTMEHEVLIGRELLVEDGVPDGYETNLFDAVVIDLYEDDWMVRMTGMIEFELEEGESLAMLVTVPEDLVGTWEIGCFIPGHYQAGMKAPFVIE